MPSSSNQMHRNASRLQVREWNPLEFQSAAQEAQQPSNYLEPKTAPERNDFVELVDIVQEKISAPQNFKSQGVLQPSKDIRQWQPETLVAIENVVGDTHDHLRSREIVQQAETRLQQAQTEAERILAQAQAEAERILQEAQEKAILMQRQAYADGQAAANAEAQGMLQTARAIVEEVQKWKENLFEEGEMMMLRLVIEIAQTIFGDGLPLDPDALGQAFTRALSRAKSLGDLRIYLHPEDAAVLSAHWDKLKGVTAGQKVELIPSEMIKRGGCYIEGQYGTVDARVETQFQLATDALLETLEKNR